MSEELSNAINTVMEQCPDASEEDIKNEFERYERGGTLGERASQYFIGVTVLVFPS